MDAVIDGVVRSEVKKTCRADAIVTARVPLEVKEQGNAVLRKIGSTPTELVNAAYRYVLDHEALPQAEPSLEEAAERHRALSPERKAQIKAFVERTTLQAPASWEHKSFDELREEAMRDRYPEYFD